MEEKKELQKNERIENMKEKETINTTNRHSEGATATEESVERNRSFATAQDDSKRKCAFTLAETIVALTVLGLVAAITIPNFIQSYKKTYTITRLKQAYSLFTEATHRAEIISGKSSDNWDLTNTNDLYNYFVPQLNIAHDCRQKGNTKRCIGVSGKEIYGNSNPGYTYVKRTQDSYQYFAWLNSNSMILKNGMSVGYYLQSIYPYIQLVIDINGPSKGPNMINKDVFYLFFTKAQSDTIDKNPRFHPYTVTWSIKKLSYDKARTLCTDYSANTGGETCFAYIIMSGWKIPKDYPVKF